MKNIHSLILMACAALMLATIPTGTVTCKRDLVPDGSIELQGLPGGAQIKSGGGKTVISLPAVSVNREAGCLSPLSFVIGQEYDRSVDGGSAISTPAKEWQANAPAQHPSGYIRVAWTDPDLLKRPIGDAADRHCKEFTTSALLGRVCHRGV